MNPLILYKHLLVTGSCISVSKSCDVRIIFSEGESSPKRTGMQLEDLYLMKSLKITKEKRKAKDQLQMLEKVCFTGQSTIQDAQ